MNIMNINQEEWNLSEFFRFHFNNNGGENHGYRWWKYGHSIITVDRNAGHIKVEHKSHGNELYYLHTCDDVKKLIRHLNHGNSGHKSVRSI